MGRATAHRTTLEVHKSQRRDCVQVNRPRGPRQYLEHAGATRARLVLDIGGSTGEEETLRGPWLDLMIEDDGCNGNKEGKGLGLIGMRERVMPLGGQLEAASGAERGFKL